MILDDSLRWYLLAGLVAHKALWEWMKRGAARAPRAGFVLGVVKAVKVAVLAGVAVQTLLPDVLPIAEEPAVLRTVGGVIYSIGLATALAGRLQLGSNWSDIEAAKILGEHVVVSHGVYRYVRHPIYSGDLTLLIGLELALNSWLVLGVLVLAPLVLRQAVQEERALAKSLPGYAEYCARTKRFIPFVA